MASRQRELAAQLFGLTDASEAQTKMASRISEAILSDLIQHATKAWRDDGPGVLVIRRTKDDARWSPAGMLEQNLAIAESAGDTAMARAFASTLKAIDGLNIDSVVPIAIADHTGWRLLLLPTDNPAARVAELLETWND
ncbi:MAG: hypothetical protein LW834_17000 [Cyanobium sp. 49614_E6]|jgi:hypothetical protein|nr:hypothetical protein [Cyanobium sp. 49614_E6]